MISEALAAKKEKTSSRVLCATPACHGEHVKLFKQGYATKMWDWKWEGVQFQSYQEMHCQL